MTRNTPNGARHRRAITATTITITRPLLVALALALVTTLGLAGCSDDSSAQPDGKTLRDGTVGDVGDASGIDISSGDASDSAPPKPGVWAVLIRGELSTTDIAAAKTLHDTAAAGGEQAAKGAGDIAHDALLGTTLLGTSENEFLGIDQWSKPDNIEAFYKNPDFQKAFAPIFKSPPAPGIFKQQTDWHGWGDLAAGDGTDAHFFVVIRGRLKLSDTAQSKTAHDAIAAGGEPQAKAAGDVAHVVFLGIADPREFFAVDVWKSDTGLAAFYSNPAFQTAFGALFEGQASVAVYRSTDWHQW